MSSIPAMVAAADRNDLNPSIDRTMRLNYAFDGAVVLLHDVVEVFDPTDFNACLAARIVAFNRRRVGATFVDGDLRRNTVLTERLAQETKRSPMVPLGGQ
jgi:hypothetical protein